MADEHVEWLDNNFLSDEWSAACSCGWDGPARVTRDEAHDDWENHVDVVFMESTMGRWQRDRADRRLYGWPRGWAEHGHA